MALHAASRTGSGGRFGCGFAMLLGCAAVLSAQHIVTWGNRIGDSTWHDESFVEIAVGETHTVARRAADRIL